MKTVKQFLLALVALIGLAACEKDEDKIYLNGIDASELIATESAVELSQANSNEIVLSLAWTKDALQISDPDLTAVDITTQTLQVSLTADFSGTISESVETSLSKAYTGSALNTLAKNIGATVDKANDVYFRIAAQLGSNMDPVYSNVVAVSITPYYIDMTLAYLLDTSLERTGTTLYSADSDGDYWGFVGATSWYNFYVEEGDGTIWGNDGVDGSPFLISSEDTKWNCWFPGQAGCYYVNLNTNTGYWSSLYIPTLTLTGDLQGEMTFSRPNLQWTYVFNATTTGSITFQVGGTGSQYNYTTSTDDDAAIETSVGFAQSGTMLTFGAASGDITLNVPAVGECTLTIDLSDPTGWTAQISSGAAEAEATVYPYLYLPGVDDLISGSWTFDNYLSLYDEANLRYAGVVNVSSEWGYQIAVEPDNWSDIYTLGEGDAYAGSLTFQGSQGNLPAPTAGVYLFDISLQEMTYALTALGDAIYLSGLNDVWDFATTLRATSDPGVYSGSITISQVSEWGFKIYLFADDWDHAYGGSGGSLYYNGSNLTDDADLGVGTYTMTVDLIHGTYQFK